jgi:spore germination protein GerM
MLLVTARAEVMCMTGETILDLLKPLVGKSGSLSLIVSRIGQIGFTASENKKLTGVELRDDGLLLLERESGWTVLDPAEVVAVAWMGEAESSPGLFL